MSNPEVAFVTGAGSGIGRAVARRLAKRGAAVGLFDRAGEGLSETAATIRGDGGGAVLELIGDVSVEADLAAAVAATVAELGPLRAAVAAAGIELIGNTPSTTLDDWSRVIEVNLTGVFLTAKQAIPLLEGSKGTFTAIASDAGIQGAQGFAAYCASKHGVIGLVRCLALDHGPAGVRSNVVCPGFVETPMADRIFAGQPEAERERWRQTVPLGRFARPEEVAEAVAHLTSPQASYVNGHTYVIDGGGTAGYFESQTS